MTRFAPGASRWGVRTRPGRRRRTRPGAPANETRSAPANETGGTGAPEIHPAGYGSLFHSSMTSVVRSNPSTLIVPGCKANRAPPAASICNHRAVRTRRM